MENWTNLYDVSKCTACRGCVVQCKNWNKNPAIIEPFKGNYGCKSDTDEDTYTVIRFMEEEETGNPMKPIEWRFLKFQCMHCFDPECMKVCPTGCISKTEWGAVVKDYDKCVGCKYCTYACPFLIPKYRPRQDKTTKCTLCSERVSAGLAGVDDAAVKVAQEGSRLKDPTQSKIKESFGIPACAKTCPSGALKFGKRSELLKEAKARVKELQKQGFTYATIYGERELGGLNKLYVLTDNPEKFGLPVLPAASGLMTFWKEYAPWAGWLVPLTLGASAVSFVTSRILANKHADEHGEHDSEGGHE